MTQVVGYFVTQVLKMSKDCEWQNSLVREMFLWCCQLVLVKQPVLISVLPFAFDLYQERDLENRAIIIVISPLAALILDKV